MSVQPINFPRGPIVDPQTGAFTPQAQRFFIDIYRKLGQASNNAPINSLNITELLNLGTQVTNQLGSGNIKQNVMFNYSNNATVDSIDNGTNATIRAYGPGGVGTTWHQFIGANIGPENPAFSGTAPYAASRFVVYNGSSYVITANASDTLADGIIWAASIKTVSAGGAGGVSGGGGTGGGGGGRLKDSIA